MEDGQWAEEGGENSEFELAYQVIMKVDLAKEEDGTCSRQLGSLIQNV